MTTWLDYRKARPGCGRSIAGTLRLLEGVDGGELRNRRDPAVTIRASLVLGLVFAGSGEEARFRWIA